MPTLCRAGCIPLCDFCNHYNFNGDEQGRYTEDGRCTLHDEASEPYYYCEDFYCFLADKEKEEEKWKKLKRVE